MRTKHRLGAAALLAAGSLLLPGDGPRASEGEGPPQVAAWIPVNADARWWQFVLSFPFGEDPVSDPTGALCQVGQYGAAWTLYGPWSGTVERHCTVPTGKRLFFPVYNWVNVAFPGDTPKLLREQLAPLVAAGDVLEVELDSQLLPSTAIRRLRSGVFEVVLQEENLFDASFPVPAGVYGPAVADGYWTLLNPLPAGDHELRIHGGSTSLGIDLEATYHLHVVAPEGIVPP